MHIFISFYIIIIICSYKVLTDKDFWDKLNFHPNLLSWHISSDKNLFKKCRNDLDCPISKDLLNKDQCFGFERNCKYNNSYSYNKIKCYKDSKWPQGKNKHNQKMTFWEQADFGSVLPRINSMKILCDQQDNHDSYLECSDHLRICKAKNIFFNFKDFTSKGSARYRNDIIKQGLVGGKCHTLDKTLLSARTDEKSYLQSWGYELEHFESYDDFKMNSDYCDIIFDKPTVIIKLDASINMYHHFCDFINLYMSQFLNGSFSQDIEIFWWDTHSTGFVDEYFGDVWKVFSFNKPHELIDYEKKRVCFRNALLPQLARQRLGIYYNMPLIDGCQGSGFFDAFSKHMIHRLNIIQNGPLLDKIRITFLQRNSIARKIININTLLEALNNIENVDAKIVIFDKNIPFVKQVEIIHNTDIFIGIHGAGLTHMFFLPEWASVFEIYNCGDEGCYYDLARLRGVKYFTWEKEELITIEKEGIHPNLKTPHRKFHNYSFDVQEFIRIVKKAIEYVRRHSEFVEQRRKIRRANKLEL